MHLPYQLEPVLRTEASLGPAAAGEVGPSANLKFRCKDELLRIKSGGDSTLTFYPCEVNTAWEDPGVKSNKRIDV